jgi:plastin-1
MKKTTPVIEYDDFGGMPAKKPVVIAGDDFGGMPVAKPPVPAPAPAPVPASVVEIKKEVPPRPPEGRRASNLRIEAPKLSDALDFVNAVLKDDPDFKAIIPIKDETKLMEEVQDGIMLAKLINFVIPETVDLKAFNRGPSLNSHLKQDNLRLSINGALKIGCASSTLSPHMILQGKSILVISVMCQLKKMKELKDLQKTPELIVLAEKGEPLEVVYKLPSETIIMRWLNYHIKKAGKDIKIRDLGKDLQDGVVYVNLLNQIQPYKCSLEGLAEVDTTKRMKMVLNNAVNIGVSHSFNMAELLEGSSKLHIILCCMIFNVSHGLKSTLPYILLTNEFLRSLGG